MQDTYSVRVIFLWGTMKSEEFDFLYEERITVWSADSFEAAIDLAEGEAKSYAKENGFECLDLFQAFRTVKGFDPPAEGSEVFSLLRESNLPPVLYLDTFFDTNHERAENYERPISQAEDT